MKYITYQEPLILLTKLVFCMVFFLSALKGFEPFMYDYEGESSDFFFSVLLTLKDCLYRGVWITLIFFILAKFVLSLIQKKSVIQYYSEKLGYDPEIKKEPKNRFGFFAKKVSCYLSLIITGIYLFNYGFDDTYTFLNTNKGALNFLDFFELLVMIAYKLILSFVVYFFSLYFFLKLIEKKMMIQGYQALSQKNNLENS